MSSRRIRDTPYEIVRELGFGGMGVTYLARDVRVDRLFVVKLLYPEPDLSAEARERFLREARGLVTIRHRNVVETYDFGQLPDGRRLVVSEYVEGETLAAKLLRGPLSVKECVPLVAQALEGLQVAHQAGVVHRDLKPGNLIVTKNGTLKLIDFGLAKDEVLSLGESVTDEAVFTSAVRYLSPEQVSGRPATPASDIYVMGSILFECLVGRPMFDGASARDVVQSHLHQSPPELELLDKAESARLQTVVWRAVAKVPEERFPSATAFVTALHTKSTHLVGAFRDLRTVPARQSCPSFGMAVACAGDAKSSDPAIRRQTAISDFDVERVEPRDPNDDPISSLDDEPPSIRGLELALCAVALLMVVVIAAVTAVSKSHVATAHHVLATPSLMHQLAASVSALPSVQLPAPAASSNDSPEDPARPFARAPRCDERSPAAPRRSDQSDRPCRGR